MAFYLDSADQNDIRAALALPWCAGVTTNPTLLARAAGGAVSGPEQYLARLRAVVATAGELPVFAQVPECDGETMAQWAEDLRQLASDRVILKIPCTAPGLALAANCSRRGWRVAVTAVFSVTQVVLAAEAGSHWAAPYCHRYTEHGGDGLVLVESMLAALRLRQSPLRLLVASVKTREEIERLLELGAPDLTLPLPLLAGLADHPLTADALAQFNAAITA